MDNKIKSFVLTLIGTIYITLGILAFYNAIRYSETAGILWFSYIAFFLIGLGIITRNSYLIASQINIILIAYIFWNIDFFYILITSNSLWGITNYFFSPRPTLSQLITLQHIFTIPVSLFSIYLIKLKRRDFWKFSLAQITIFFFIIRIIGSGEENINCVFENCLPLRIPFVPYPIVWFLAYIIMIFLTTLLLTKTKIFLEK